MDVAPEAADGQNASDAIAPPKGAFRFGRNWLRYVDHYLDADRERIAAESIDVLIGPGSLAGRSFLDIGAGSGLFSLCAYRAGADRVISFDVDPESVESCRRLRAEAGDPDNWSVLHGSVLNSQLVSSLEPADVVYAWGVLHHTGDMYLAIRNAARLVSPGGRFAIAIYNRVEGRFLNSARWLRIKRLYSGAPLPIQGLMKSLYFSYWICTQLRGRRNPWRTAREYKRSRGMALRTDLWDWLGGYPYEYASVEEILSFCESECGLEVEKVNPRAGSGTGNNEFVFRRTAGTS